MKNLLIPCLLTCILFSCNKTSDSEDTTSSADAVLAKDFRTDIVVKSITVTSSNPDQPAQNYSGTYTIVYENGTPLRMDYLGTDSSKWTSKIMRDPVGNIVKVESINEGGAAPVVARYYEYHYTGDLLTAKNNAVLRDGKHVPVFRTLYTYNDKKQLIKEDILTSTEKPERILNYEYADDSTNPSKISIKNFLSNSEYANEYVYDTTDSPLVLFHLIRGDVALALVTKNLKSRPLDPAKDKSPLTPLYEYNDKNLPVKITYANSGNNTTVFDIQY
jgi:hypothetical protein